MHSAIILIPARYESSRFPGKPLADIKGKSLVQRVYEGCSQIFENSYVVTDDDRIESHVKEFGKVLRVNDPVESGSERIGLALERFFTDQNIEFVVNVQGDEPLIRGELLKELIEFHATSPFDITTVVKERSTEEEDWTNPNVVKALYSDVKGECHYFSRSSIPYVNQPAEWYQHIGIYCYRVESLKKFINAAPSLLERRERLEQLRALDLEMRIGAIKTDLTLAGVDTPEDIQRIEEVIS